MKSKLFLSLSLLTAVFSMSPKSELIFPRWHKDAIQWMYKNPIGRTHPVDSRFAAKYFTPEQMTEAMYQVAPQSPAEAAYAQAWINYSKETVALPAPSRIAKFMVHPNAPIAGFGAAYVAGLATVAGGMKLANDYMQPEVKPTYFERAKAQVQAGYKFAQTNVAKGYNSSLTLVKAHPYRSAGAVAAVAALGYAAYKGEIFGNSKAVVTTPEVKETPVACVVAMRKHLRD